MLPIYYCIIIYYYYWIYCAIIPTFLHVTFSPHFPWPLYYVYYSYYTTLFLMMMMMMLMMMGVFCFITLCYVIIDCTPSFLFHSLVIYLYYSVYIHFMMMMMMILIWYVCIFWYILHFIAVGYPHRWHVATPACDCYCYLCCAISPVYYLPHDLCGIYTICCAHIAVCWCPITPDTDFLFDVTLRRCPVTLRC